MLNAANEVAVAAFLAGRVAVPRHRGDQRGRARRARRARRAGGAAARSARRARRRRLGARARARVARCDARRDRREHLTTSLSRSCCCSAILVFVHELGHFLVANACDVRVLKFSIGFGPPIGIGRCRLAWNAQRHRVRDRVVPARRLREDARRESRTRSTTPRRSRSPDESLAARSRPGRSSRSSSPGPAMNLLLPVVVFMAMLAVGMPRPARR